MATTERVDGPTPSGGDYAIISYYGADGLPAEPEEAARCTIAEYTEDGELVSETFGLCKPD